MPAIELELYSCLFSIPTRCQIVFFQKSQYLTLIEYFKVITQHKLFTFYLYICGVPQHFVKEENVRLLKKSWKTQQYICIKNH